MANFDLSAVTGFETIGADTANSGGTTITASGTANTKGSWTQLSASTSGDASWIEVMIGSSTIGRFLVDIGIGASGSETVLLSNLHFDSANSGAGAMYYRLPVAIAAGTRIAARVQASVGSRSVRVMAILFSGDAGSLTPPGSVTSYGANTADSGLTSVDPGTSANTDGSWVEITSSTSSAMRWLLIAFGHDASTFNGSRWLVDIAVGASGSESTIISDIFVVQGSAAAAHPEQPTLGFPVNIASGTRLAVRARSPETSSPYRLLDVAIYGASASVPSGGGVTQHAHAAWGA